MKIENRYFETLTQAKPLLKKDFSGMTSFYFARLFSKIEIESKVYFSEKQKLIEKYAKRNEDGTFMTTGDSVMLDNPQEFTEKLEEIMSIEIELGIDKIDLDFDKEPKINIEGMMLLLPFIGEVKNG